MRAPAFSSPMTRTGPGLRRGQRSREVTDPSLAKKGQCRVGAGNAEFQFAGVFRASERDSIISSTFKTVS